MIVSVENDQIIGEPNNSGLPSATVFEDWKCSGNRCFQPVQGHIHQEGGQHAPLRGTGFRGEEFLPIHDARLEPGGNRPSQGRERVEFGDKRLVTNPIKAFFDVRVQDVFVLLVDAGMNGLNRIVTRASWSEAVAIGLELRLPLRFQSEFRQGLSSAIRYDGDS
jgi:hypothetical protein